MRILADENFPKPLIAQLRAAGHDLTWAGNDFDSTSDKILIELAEAQSRIVFTLDKDFWQIALQRPQPLSKSAVVLFRVHPATPDNVANLVHRVLQLDEIRIGHAALVTPQGIHLVASGGGRKTQGKE